MHSRPQPRTNHADPGWTGQDVIIFFGGFTTRRLGGVWVAASASGLVAVELGGPRARFEAALSHRTNGVVRFAPGRVRDAIDQIREYLQGKRRAFELPIDWSAIPGSFQSRALAAVLSIPYGQTRTYKQVASQIGRPRAVRAVGRANATNPLPLVIPCHRVIGADGSLRGYGGAGGVATKAWLLQMETSHLREASWRSVRPRNAAGRSKHRPRNVFSAG